MCPRLYIEAIDGVTVVNLADEMILSEEVIAELDEQLGHLVERQEPARMLINFRDVRFMSSSMLGVLAKLIRRLERSKGRLRLCGIAPELRVVFKITRFECLFDIYPDVIGALDSF